MLSQKGPQSKLYPCQGTFLQYRNTKRTNQKQLPSNIGKQIVMEATIEKKKKKRSPGSSICEELMETIVAYLL